LAGDRRTSGSPQGLYLRTGQRLFGLAQDYYWRSSQAVGDSETGGEADRLAIHFKGALKMLRRRSAIIAAWAGASGQRHKKLVLAGRPKTS